MRALETELPEVRILEPRVFGDERGFLMESYNRRELSRALGTDPEFVQENHSRSRRYVLRGLHYQIRQSQGKLVRAVVGEIFDVAVDLRRSSPNFGKWAGARLSAENKRQLWVPEGFAHGFLVLSDEAEVLYKITDFHAPEWERAILWNDPEIGIRWPITGEPILSDRDRAGVRFAEAEVFE